MSNMKKISRRDFLKFASLAGGAGVLAACGVKETALPPTAVPTEAAAGTAASAVEATAAPAKLSVAPGWISSR